MGGPKVKTHQMILSHNYFFRLMLVLQDVKLLWILMEGGEPTEVEHSQEKIHLRWIVLHAMLLAGLPSL